MVVIRCAFGGSVAILLLISVSTREQVFLAPGRLVLVGRSAMPAGSILPTSLLTDEEWTDFECLCSYLCQTYTQTKGLQIVSE